MDGQKLARGLGWFSIGLGLAEVLAPRGLGQLIGVRKHRGLIQTYGAREITAGVGILGQSQPTPGWVWARVAGDVLDLASLGAALGQRYSKKARVAAAIGAVAGVTVLDVLCAKQLSAGQPT